MKERLQRLRKKKGKNRTDKWTCESTVSWRNTMLSAGLREARIPETSMKKQMPRFPDQLCSHKRVKPLRRFTDKEDTILETEDEYQNLGASIFFFFFFFSLFFQFSIFCRIEKARNSGRVITGAQRSIAIDSSCWATLALANAWGINFPLESLCPSRRFPQYFFTPQRKLHSTYTKIKKKAYTGDRSVSPWPDS